MFRSIVDFPTSGLIAHHLYIPIELLDAKNINVAVGILSMAGLKGEIMIFEVKRPPSCIIPLPEVTQYSYRSNLIAGRQQHYSHLNYVDILSAAETQELLS